MRILIKTSKWAIWAQRLGSLAVPLVIIPVLLHRQRLMTSDIFIPAALLAGAVAALAVIWGLVALVHIWRSGDLGWGKALGGLFLGLLCLLPYGWFGSLAMRYPPVTDIATAERRIMPLVFEPGTTAMPPPQVLPATVRAQVFPNVETRRYPLGVAQTYALVEQMIAERGWDVRLVSPPGEAEAARINAQIMTTLGWREEAVLRIEGTAAESTVDMRSVSLHAVHDFGSNGTRIEEFLVALDDQVTTLLRDTPESDLPPEPEPD